MVADYTEIRRVAERLAGRLRAGDRVRVTSPAGSDVTMRTGGREPRGWHTAMVRRPGEISAFPGGEVSFPPLEGKTHGTVVVEHVMTDLGALSHHRQRRQKRVETVVPHNDDLPRRADDLLRR